MCDLRIASIKKVNWVNGFVEDIAIGIDLEEEKSAFDITAK